MANNDRFKIAAPQSIIERIMDSKVMKIVDSSVRNGILFTDDRVDFSRDIVDAMIDVSKEQPDENIIFAYSTECDLYEDVSYHELTNGTIIDLDNDIGKALFANRIKIMEALENIVKQEAFRIKSGLGTSRYDVFL